MNATTLLMAAAITLPVVGLCGWFWITVKQIERQFIVGFEGMHFEI